MRSSGAAPLGFGRIATALGAGALLVASCAVRAPCDPAGCPASCPRDARPDEAGRCACVTGTVLALGACVSPAVGDAYCGPGQRMGREGCTARGCAADEALDLASGACIARASVGRAAGPCAPPAVPAVRGGKIACFAPEDTCPRGTHRSESLCARPPACPPGTLPDGAGCRAFVSGGGGGADGARIDAGAWVALAIGVDGGVGSEDLCRALSLRADAFGLEPGQTRWAAIHVAMRMADQDVTRATVSAQSAAVVLDAGTSGEAATSSVLPAGAVEVIERAVESLVEPFRGLGGESTAATVDVTVRCKVGSPP